METAVVGPDQVPRANHSLASPTPGPPCLSISCRESSKGVPAPGWAGKGVQWGDHLTNQGQDSFEQKGQTWSSLPLAAKMTHIP